MWFMDYSLIDVSFSDVCHSLFGCASDEIITGGYGNRDGSAIFRDIAGIVEAHRQLFDGSGQILDVIVKSKIALLRRIIIGEPYHLVAWLARTTCGRRRLFDEMNVLFFIVCIIALGSGNVKWN